MGDKREKPAKERIEPTMQEWERVEFRRPPSHAATPGWRDRRVWRRALVGVLALALLLVALRQPLAQWLWPDTRVQRLLDAGDAALQAGRLSAADGSGARQSYEAAQALDGDRNEARAGLTRVANAALGQAREAMRAKRLDEAAQSLALARELQAPRSETDAVAAALRQLEAARAGIDQLLRQAQTAQAEGRLDGDADAALPLYRRILSLQPDNTAALEGREDALTDLLQQARQALEAGELAHGAALVAAARSYDAGHVDLPASQAQLSQALEHTRTRAAADLRNHRLERALAGYQALAEAAGGDAAQAETARQGIDRIAAAWATQSQRLAADFRFNEAETALEKAGAAAPDNAAVAAAAQYLQRVRKSHAQTAQPILSASERQRRVQTLLAAMDRAQARGDWLIPPGESAWDRLRAAQALAPGDMAVVAAEQRLLQGVRACLEDSLRSNRPTRAQACHDAWAALQPDAADLPVARRRLAQKWLAVGDEKLGAGDLAFATQALQRARALDPNASGLVQFTQRVRDAQLGAGRR
ncbi:MAG: hypothetical protein QM599_11000 [Pseudoxanthomonas sp.]